MDVVPYLSAGCSAAVVSLAAHVWLRRQRIAQPGMLGAPDRNGVVAFAMQALLLMALALVLAWIERKHSALALSQSLILLFVLYPLALLDWVTLEVDLRVVLAGLLLRIASLFVFDRPALPDAALGMVAGAGMITLASLAYRAVRGRTGLGEGDAGIMAIAGAFVGWSGLVPVLLIAAAAGALVGAVTLLALRKPFDTPIPFVPFLCAATLAVYGAQRLGWLG